MKKWVLLLLVSGLSSLPLVEVVSVNQQRQGVAVAASSVTQFPPTVVDRVWELIDSARSSAQTNQQDKALSSLSQAFELAKTIENRDARNPILVKIIAEYGAIGAYEQAIALLSPISYDEPLPDNQGDSVRMQGEVLLTQAYVKAQKYEQALQFAQNLKLDAAKQRALVEIVAGYARQGRFEKAIALGRTLHADEYQQYRAQAAILAEYIQRQQYEQALAFVQTLANKDYQNDVARSLAETAWQSGRYDIALKTAQTITNPSLQVQTLQSLAQAHLAVGQKQQAAAVISQAFELSKKTNEFTLSSWLADFISTGQEERAKAIINQMTGDENELAFPRSLAVRAYLNVGRYTEAFELAKLIPDRVLLPLTEYPDPKVEFFESIISQSLKAGQYDFAQQVALTLNGKDDQVKALQTIARHSAKNGKREQAIELLNQTLNIAKTIESITVVPERSLSWNEPNASILMAIADDYLELDQKQQALATLALAAQSIQKFETQSAFDFPVWTKGKAFRQLASLYLKQGDRQKAADLLGLAFQDVQTVKGNSFIIKESLEIATAYTKLGNFDRGAEVLEKTLPLLETVEQKPEKISLFLQIAKGFVATGKKQQGIEALKTAMALIDTLEKEQEKISPLIQAIGVYTEAGENAIANQLMNRTLPMIQRLEPDSEQTRKLDGLALLAAQNDSPTLALGIIQQAPERLDRTRMLLAIAQKYAERGNASLASELLAQALTLADTIRDEYKRDDLLATTARGMTNLYSFPQDLTGDIRQYNLATQMTRRISNPEIKAETLLQLALKYRAVGEVKESNQSLATALESAKSIEQQPQWRAKLLENIQVGLQLDEYELVLQIANAMQDADYKTVILRQIAQKYAIAGNKERATAVLSQAIQAANTIEDENARKNAIASIVQQQQQ